jgi:hypothetical protein
MARRSGRADCRVLDAGEQVTAFLDDRAVEVARRTDTGMGPDAGVVLGGRWRAEVVHSAPWEARRRDERAPGALGECRASRRRSLTGAPLTEVFCPGVAPRGIGGGI